MDRRYGTYSEIIQEKLHEKELEESQCNRKLSSQRELLKREEIELLNCEGRILNLNTKKTLLTTLYNQLAYVKAKFFYIKVLLNSLETNINNLGRGNLIDEEKRIIETKRDKLSEKEQEISSVLSAINETLESIKKDLEKEELKKTNLGIDIKNREKTIDELKVELNGIMSEIAELKKLLWTD